MVVRMKRVVVAVAAVALFASLVYAAAPRKSGRRSPRQSRGGLKVGDKAVDFELPILIERKDAKGQKVAVVTTDKVKLSGYFGKKIVCIFMSSYT